MSLRDDSLFTIEASDFSFTRCNFTRNRAITSGGIRISYITRSSQPSSFTDCVFTNNSADGKACVYVKDESRVALTRCVFVGNYALKGGADVYHDNGALTVSASTFHGAAGAQPGVSLYIGSPSSFSKSTVCFTTGSSAVYVSKTGAATMTDCSVTDSGELSLVLLLMLIMKV